MLHLSNLAVARDDIDGAERYSDEMLDIRQRLAAAEPDNEITQRDLVFGLYFASDASLLASQLKMTVDRLSRAEEIARLRLDEDPENTAAVRDLYVISSCLGDALLYDLKDYQQAARVNERVVDMARLVSEQASANAKAASELGIRLAELAHTQLNLDQISTAVATCRRAVKLL